MGKAKKILSTATGGLLGGPDVPKMKMPKAVKEEVQQIDPNKGAAISAARKRRMQAAGASGRSSFRIDLAAGGGDAGQTRSGITIG